MRMLWRSRSAESSAQRMSNNALEFCFSLFLTLTPTLSHRPCPTGKKHSEFFIGFLLVVGHETLWRKSSVQGSGGVGNFRAPSSDTATEERGNAPGVQEKVLSIFSFALLNVSESQDLWGETGVGCVTVSSLPGCPDPTQGFPRLWVAQLLCLGFPDAPKLLKVKTLCLGLGFKACHLLLPTLSLSLLMP